MKRRLRIITYAWGRDYVGTLLEVTLAAVLAPGNLPCLSGAFDCEFVLLTERGLFTQVEAHPNYRRCGAYARTRLIAIDDLLVAPLYGMTLTWATYRAMADLGDAVIETDFLFFTADWIPADGSYRSLIDPLTRGERLIVAPSYCVISELTLPLLRARIDAETGILAIPPREMAAIAIPNRHNTIRGKTINSHLFHMDIIEQFYWLADADTLLAHQMPIAIVCMRPTRWSPEPNCFWDYGTVSELCPGIVPWVIGDSDDFLMVELRGETTYDDGLRLGWPSDIEITQKLTSFVTKDHTVFGRHQLVLHSKELPATLSSDRAALQAFVDKIFSGIENNEVSHANHPFWTFQSSLFDAARHALPLATSDGQHLWSFGSKAMTSVLGGMIADHCRHVAPHGEFAEHAAQLSGSDLGESKSVSRDHADRLAVIESAVKVAEAIHQRDTALAKRSIEDLRKLEAERVSLSNYRRAAASGLAPSLNDAIQRPADTTEPHGTPQHRIGACHHMQAPMRHALRLIDAALGAGKSSVLYITSDGLDRIVQYSAISARHHVRVDAATLAFSESHIVAGPRFDLCIFELKREDLERLRHMFERVRPWLLPATTVVVFHFNEPMRAFAGDSRFIRHCFPRSDWSSVYFTGSLASYGAVRCASGISRRLKRLLGSKLSVLIGRLAAAPFSWIATTVERRTPAEKSRVPPRPSCSSMTIELDIRE